MVAKEGLGVGAGTTADMVAKSLKKFLVVVL